MTRQGITIGIKFAIVYIVVFALLGYPAVLSLLLGILAGAAGGVVGAWWMAKEEAGKVAEGELLSPFALARRRLSDWRQTRRYKIRQKRARTVRRSRKRRPQADGVAATDTTTATPPSADANADQ
jgi:hypothetical protein